MYSRFPLSHLALAVALALPFAAQAQDRGATDLDEVVVSGTRTAVAVEDSLVPAQVINREAIQRSQARSLSELLQGRAGISLANQGGAGKITTLNLRGTESDHVLVLIDGVRMGSATAGLPALQDLPIDQIDRVEIVRGPRSSLYGSEAIGGVIQVFTRRNTGKVRPNFRIGVGSDSAREASAGIGGGNARGWFGADVAHTRTDGFNACRGRGPDPGIPFDFGAGCFTDEPDRDGYRNTSANLRGGYSFTDTLTMEANALRAEGKSEFDGSFTNRSETVQQVIGTKLRYAPSEKVGLQLSLGRNDDKSDDFHDDVQSGYFETRRYVASLQGDFTVAANQLLTAGIDWQDDKVESATDFDITQRDNLAGFVEYQGRFGAHQLQASVRNDDNEQFGNHTTGSLGYGFGFENGLKLTASVATGFKAPSFNDLYYPFFGNPDLKPEESESVNLGIARYADSWNWTFNVYQNKVDQLISYDAAIFLPNNIDEARIRGAEFTVDFTLGGFDIATQLSHTDPRNRSAGPNHDNLLARRPRNTARIDVDRAFGAFRTGVTFNAAGERYDNLANTDRLGGYSTLDLRLEYAIAPAWTLQAKVGNVFDRDYETVAWYNQAGRTYGLSLRYQPTE
ncbi:TonB-dependent vitamin B12 receptor [Pseudoxanthomonas sp. PXM03]|uniref:TonB-dependent vitamin B12 receptor n=1 Tax=Pseudoxanthomonas sp. PXM03 TaxID=2769284 RepID=UPI001783D78A|nr:TonB-dependent vitamin B12 receptor [Pseudoxanthomonas sp. PXM03]MBD9437820.1 TonB-dependent vitamin B12 receptor [Pseudoxanthomonas sp. PXM03]